MTDQPAPSATTESLPSTYFRLLRGGPFSRYMLGEGISMIGTWMQMSAQYWLVTTLTPKATALGGLVLVGGVPTLLLTMLGGTVADRFDKRRILFISLAVQISLALLVGWLTHDGLIRLWHLYVVTALLGVVSAFEVPTVSAFVPELVGKDDLAKALAIDRSVFHFTRMIGPALGGYLVAKLGVSIAYYLNAVTFLALIAAIISIPARARGDAKEEEERQGPMRAGFDFVRRDPPTRAMIQLMGSAAVFVSPFFIVTLPVYAVHELHLDAQRLGDLMAFSGVGSLTGALALLTIHKGKRARFLKLGAAVATLGLAGLASAPSFGWTALSIVLMTFGLSSGFGTANIVIQERAPDAIRGRVSGVASLAFFGVLPFAGLGMSALSDGIGLRQTMFLGTAGFALTAFFLLAGRKQLASAPPSEPSL